MDEHEPETSPGRARDHRRDGQGVFGEFRAVQGNDDGAECHGDDLRSLQARSGQNPVSAAPSGTRPVRAR